MQKIRDGLIDIYTAYRRRAVSRAVCILLALSLALLAECTLPALNTLHTVLADGDTTTIQILGSTRPSGFSPALLTVHVNDIVIFSNQASPATTYTISSDDGSISSPPIAPGKQWSISFSSPGEHEYHTGSSQTSMIGEILVVASSVTLLPTPAPDVEATVVTMIKAGKTPSDTIAIPTPAPDIKQTQLQNTTALVQSNWVLLVLCILGGILLVGSLGTGLFLLGRYSIPRIRTFLKRTFRRRNDDDEDEDDEEYEYEEEYEYA